MKNSKGFTLIELLAIIVILAIIAVVTVPLILNIINDAQKNASIDSAYGYKSALEKYYMKKVVENTENELPNGYKEISELPEDFAVSGESPSEGWVKLKKGIVQKFSLKYNEYVVTMDSEKNITSEKQETVEPRVTRNYKEVEYLESTGSQYIDTEYLPNNNTKLEMKFIALDTNPTGAVPLFGARSNNGKKTFTTFYKTSNIGTGRPDFGDQLIGDRFINFQPNTLYYYIKDKEQNYLDGINVSNNISSEFNSEYSLYLYDINTNGVSYGNGTNNNRFNGKIYSVKIYENENEIRDYVPVIRKSDNKPGMLDLTNLGKNLFDKDNATIVNRFVSTDKKIATSSNARSIIIPCQPNTTYTFSKIQSTRFYLGYTTAEIETGTDVYNNTIDNNATQITITTGDNAKYLVVYVYNSAYDTNTTLEDILDSAQLEFGSVATPYEPYKKSFYTNAGSGDDFITGPEI